MSTRPPLGVEAIAGAEHLLVGVARTEHMRRHAGGTAGQVPLARQRAGGEEAVSVGVNLAFGKDRDDGAEMVETRELPREIKRPRQFSVIGHVLNRMRPERVEPLELVGLDLRAGPSLARRQFIHLRIGPAESGQVL
jgi:hypothetical protein